MNELLILVDEQDNELGGMEKLTVHQLGLLHRAFSVFVFNSKNELLLQQRGDEKYHSAGLWSNTCCSHPRQGENIAEATGRRLNEEMGLQCELEFEFSFIYKFEFENGLTEHEFDHVYFGKTDALPIPNSAEVKGYKYMSLQDLERGIGINPQNYSAWLKICLPTVVEHFNQKSIL